MTQVEIAPIASSPIAFDFETKLERVKRAIEGKIEPLSAPFPSVVLFFSVSDGTSRARVIRGVGNDFDTAWSAGVKSLTNVMRNRTIKGHHLRVDWVERTSATTWAGLRTALQDVKRNYTRRGLTLDNQFEKCFTEQEINASAMLYGGHKITSAILNEENFTLAAQQKYGTNTKIDFSDDRPVWYFDTLGAYCGDDGVVHSLYGRGRNAGRRVVEKLDEPILQKLIWDSSKYLTAQVEQDGKFIYGYHPCFDRGIPTYNTLRHASTSYSMLEGWEETRDPALMHAIERSLDYLAKQAIHYRGDSAYVVDTGNEVKLGANATTLLAMSKYTALTGNQAYMPLMEKLALGILSMQNQDGGFHHVFNWPDMSLKEPFRIVYYEGEAAFALMRLYNLTKDSRWIEAVEHAFEHFIEKNYWKFHDHWLSYCTNELTLYRPDLRYFKFGIQNFEGFLDFVLERITTFPTLLELMMAGRKMLDRLETIPDGAHLLAGVDQEKFDRALHTRAAYLLNGHFWPEYAMYMRNPNRIMGSFFVRHHAFRVRIDDVEHYLSGLTAYLHYMQGKSRQ